MEQQRVLHEDAVRRLARLEELPVVDHVAVYEELHRDLRDSLSDDATPDDDAVEPRH